MVRNGLERGTVKERIVKFGQNQIRYLTCVGCKKEKRANQMLFDYALADSEENAGLPFCDEVCIELYESELAVILKSVLTRNGRFIYERKSK